MALSAQKHIYTCAVFITSEIDALHKARQKLSVDFRRTQSEYLTATSQLSQQETEEKEKESLRREEERKARRRRQ